MKPLRPGDLLIPRVGLHWRTTWLYAFRGADVTGCLGELTGPALVISYTKDDRWVMVLACTGVVGFVQWDPDHPFQAVSRRLLR